MNFRQQRRCHPNEEFLAATYSLVVLVQLRIDRSIDLPDKGRDGQESANPHRSPEFLDRISTGCIDDRNDFLQHEVSKYFSLGAEEETERLTYCSDVVGWGDGRGISRSTGNGSSGSELVPVLDGRHSESSTVDIRIAFRYVDRLRSAEVPRRSYGFRSANSAYLKGGAVSVVADSRELF